ncbi:MAG: gamma-glutamylcyclotransferase [Candidatus Rokubacteria bacterium]|nr:gamma-glutamylcyclotransferase [Candidatus Rokubacteria bacterium]
MFVYGTLMRGQPAHAMLAGHATFVGEGTVPGTLLALGRYPGAVAGRRRVRGELWLLARPEVLRTLDEYEGYNFERRVTVAMLASGRRVRTWIYRYRGRRDGRATAIPDGDWRTHRWR